MAALTEKEAALLLDKNFGSLATLKPDGSPQVTPVRVDWDGEYALVNTLKARAKPGQVDGDPRVELAVFDRENPYRHADRGPCGADDGGRRGAHRQARAEVPRAGELPTLGRRRARAHPDQARPRRDLQPRLGTYGAGASSPAM